MQETDLTFVPTRWSATIKQRQYVIEEAARGGFYVWVVESGRYTLLHHNGDNTFTLFDTQSDAVKACSEHAHG